MAVFIDKSIIFKGVCMIKRMSLIVAAFACAALNGMEEEALLLFL
jgi:hypothetical protein